MSVVTRSFLRQFTVAYTQPPEYPPETLEARMGNEEAEEGWTGFMGQMIRSGEEEGEGRRRPREVEDIHDTTRWHRLSNRPERFFETQLPRLGMNAIFRTMIQGSNRSFNPLFFVSLREAVRAAQRRDLWIRSTWPLFTEKAVPGQEGDQLEVVRCKAQQLMMDYATECRGRWRRVLRGTTWRGWRTTWMGRARQWRGW
jgi:hypothetical protein